MTRPTLLIALCLLLLPLPAMARLAGPLQVGQPSQVRDLAQIRSSQVLRVLVNQSRNTKPALRIVIGCTSAAVATHTRAG